jgi:FMN phosphatase YigB (HAD superfamily)
LFQQMLNTERCAPNAVWHIGDNLLSDVEVPYRLGIQAVHFSLAAGSSAK